MIQKVVREPIATIRITASGKIIWNQRIAFVVPLSTGLLLLLGCVFAVDGIVDVETAVSELATVTLSTVGSAKRMTPSEGNGKSVSPFVAGWLAFPSPCKPSARQRRRSCSFEDTCQFSYHFVQVGLIANSG